MKITSLIALPVLLLTILSFQTEINLEKFQSLAQVGGVSGCTVPKADNYDSKATLDDGSCKGCKDPINTTKYVGDQYVSKIKEENNTCKISREAAGTGSGFGSPNLTCLDVVDPDTVLAKLSRTYTKDTLGSDGIWEIPQGPHATVQGAPLNKVLLYSMDKRQVIQYDKSKYSPASCARECEIEEPYSRNYKDTTGGIHSGSTCQFRERKIDACNDPSADNFVLKGVPLNALDGNTVNAIYANDILDILPFDDNTLSYHKSDDCTYICSDQSAENFNEIVAVGSNQSYYEDSNGDGTLNGNENSIVLYEPKSKEQINSFFCKYDNTEICLDNRANNFGRPAPCKYTVIKPEYEEAVCTMIGESKIIDQFQADKGSTINPKGYKQFEACGNNGTIRAITIANWTTVFCDEEKESCSTPNSSDANNTNNENEEEDEDKDIKSIPNPKEPKKYCGPTYLNFGTEIPEGYDAENFCAKGAPGSNYSDSGIPLTNNNSSGNWNDNASNNVNNFQNSIIDSFKSQKPLTDIVKNVLSNTPLIPGLDTVRDLILNNYPQSPSSVNNIPYTEEENDYQEYLKDTGKSDNYQNRYVQEIKEATNTSWPEAEEIARENPSPSRRDGYIPPPSSNFSNQDNTRSDTPLSFVPQSSAPNLVSVAKNISDTAETFRNLLRSASPDGVIKKSQTDFVGGIVTGDTNSGFKTNNNSPTAEELAEALSKPVESLSPEELMNLERNPIYLPGKESEDKSIITYAGYRDSESDKTTTGKPPTDGVFTESFLEFSRALDRSKSLNEKPQTQDSSAEDITQPTTEFEDVDFGYTNFRKGDKSEDIEKWQESLELLGFLEKGNITGYFGEKTAEATKEFEKSQKSFENLKPTGNTVGPESKIAMNEALKELHNSGTSNTDKEELVDPEKPTLTTETSFETRPESDPENYFDFGDSIIKNGKVGPEVTSLFTALHILGFAETSDIKSLVTPSGEEIIKKYQISKGLVNESGKADGAVGPITKEAIGDDLYKLNTDFEKIFNPDGKISVDGLDFPSNTGLPIDRSDLVDKVLNDQKTLEALSGKVEQEVLGIGGEITQEKMPEVVADVETILNRYMIRFGDTDFSLMDELTNDAYRETIHPSAHYYPTNNPGSSENPVLHEIIKQVITKGTNTTSGATGNASGDQDFGIEKSRGLSQDKRAGETLSTYLEAGKHTEYFGVEGADLDKELPYQNVNLPISKPSSSETPVIPASYGTRGLTPKELSKNTDGSDRSPAKNPIVELPSREEIGSAIEYLSSGVNSIGIAVMDAFSNDPKPDPSYPTDKIGNSLSDSPTGIGNGENVDFIDGVQTGPVIESQNNTPTTPESSGSESDNNADAFPGLGFYDDIPVEEILPYGDRSVGVTTGAIEETQVNTDTSDKSNSILSEGLETQNNSYNPKVDPSIKTGEIIGGKLEEEIDLIVASNLLGGVFGLVAETLGVDFSNPLNNPGYDYSTYNNSDPNDDEYLDINIPNPKNNIEIPLIAEPFEDFPSPLGEPLSPQNTPINPTESISELQKITQPKSISEFEGIPLDYPIETTQELIDKNLVNNEGRVVPFEDLTSEDQNNPEIQRLYKEINLFPDAKYTIEGQGNSSDITPTLPAGSNELPRFIQDILNSAQPTAQEKVISTPLQSSEPGGQRLSLSTTNTIIPSTPPVIGGVVATTFKTLLGEETKIETTNPITTTTGNSNISETLKANESILEKLGEKDTSGNYLVSQDDVNKLKSEIASFLSTDDELKIVVNSNGSALNGDIVMVENQSSQKTILINKNTGIYSEIPNNKLRFSTLANVDGEEILITAFYKDDSTRMYLINEQIVSNKGLHGRNGSINTNLTFNGKQLNLVKGGKASDPITVNGQPTTLIK